MIFIKCDDDSHIISIEIKCKLLKFCNVSWSWTRLLFECLKFCYCYKASISLFKRFKRFLQDWSRPVRSEESFSNSDKNQDITVLVKNDWMSSSCVHHIQYFCGWRRKRYQTWLIKSWSFIRSSSKNFASSFKILFTLMELNLLQYQEYVLKCKQLEAVW